MMALVNTLYRAAQICPDRQSIVDGGRRFTWAQTLNRTRRLATVLRKHSAANGRVAILSANCAEYVELSYATAIAGAVFMPVNTRLAAPERKALFAEAEPELLLFDAAHAEAASQLRQEISSLRDAIQIGEGGDYERRLLDAQPADPVEVRREDDWAIIYTGGTTGRPKGARLSHRAITHNLTSILVDMNWGDAPVFLQTTPLFHLAGLGPSYAVTAMCGTQVLMPQFSVEAWLATMERERCTASALVPTMVNRVLNADSLDHRDLSAWVHMGYGASSIPVSVLERLLDRFPKLSLTQFYGQTEACGGLSSLKAADHRDRANHHRLASAGRPLFNTQVRIVDPTTGKIAEPGQAGEVTARTDGLFSGYLGHDSLTAQTVRDGWLHTGDIGRLDEDGYLFIVDRLKDMIVSGGENISSAEVESALLKHRDVRDVCVIGLPDPDWGERVHAVVVAKRGRHPDDAELIATCREHIAGYKCPKSITVTDEPLPLSALGKVRKDVLRERYKSAAGGRALA